MTKNRAKNRQLLAGDRSQRGNMVVLGVAITLGLLIAVALFCFNYTRLLGGSQEHTNAIEAAGLTAARELSRVVIEDPNYGFIGLSDAPPIGAATLAGDGEPMPVLGINTIVGTARLDMLVAHELKDKTMADLAMQDVRNAREAARRLSEAMQAAIKPGAEAKDMDGQTLKPYDDAKAAYETNTVRMGGGGKPVDGSFKLTLGWLEGGSTTLTPIPEPQEMAQVSHDQQQNGRYKSFVNVPCNGEDFYFAGLDNNATLVDPTRFREADGVRVPSVVKAEADHAITEYSKDRGATSHVIHNVACAQAGGTHENPPAGTISISFPSGPVPNIDKPGDLFTDKELIVNKGLMFSPEGGDWPGSGTLEPSTFTIPEPSVAQTWSIGFYNWVRNGRTKPNLKSLQELQQLTFEAMGLAGDMRVLGAAPSLVAPAYAANEGDSLEGKSVAGIVSLADENGNDPRLAAMKDPARRNSPEIARAYWGVASYSSVGSQVPPNTFLISFDESGNIYSADGKKPLDRKVIEAYWMAVMESSAAGLATMAMANQVSTLAQQACQGITQQVAELKRQVDEGQKSLSSGLGPSGEPLTPEEQRNLVNNINAWNGAIAPLEAQLQAQQVFIEAAQSAYKNGSAVVSVTDTMIRNQRSLSKQGVEKLTDNTFKLYGVVFTAHRTPPASLDAIRNRQAPSGDGTDWTTTGPFPVYDMPNVPLVMNQADGGSFMQPAHAKSVMPPALLKMYMFEFDDRGHVVSTVLPSQPFQNLPVSDRQLFGVNYRAKVTGKELPVVWTMTFRCNTARLGRQNGGIHGGEPLVGSALNWCSDTSFGDDPGKRGKKGSKGGKKGSKGDATIPGANDPRLALFGMQPAYAAPGGSKGKPGGEPPGQAKKVRQNYICGGLSTEFQLRTPVTTGTTSSQEMLLSVPRTSDLLNTQSLGSPCTVTVGGMPLPVPGVSGLTVKSQGGPVGPGCTIGPGGSQATELVPALPLDLL